MTQKIKLLLLIPHLGGGGAEQVTAHLARSLDPNRFCIHLALMTPDGPGAQPLPHWVNVHRFDCSRVRQGWRQILQLMRRIKPHVVLSNMAHLNFLILLLKPLLPIHTRILVRQNASPTASRMQRFAYRFLYPRADAVICQSQSMADAFASQFRLSHRRLAVLHNPVDIQSIRVACQPAEGSLAPRENAWPHLLSVGRLSHEKGFDLLLRVASHIRMSYPNMQVTILGIGPKEGALRQLSRELQIGNSLHLPGYISNPASYYPQTTLFVLPSRQEGMPNALLEAAAAGLPLVATPCCDGVQELLKGAPCAWLAADTTSEALADAILQALAALPRPPAPAMRFQHSFLAPFALEAAIAAYENLIESVATQAWS